MVVCRQEVSFTLVGHAVCGGVLRDWSESFLDSSRLGVRVVA